MNITVIGGDSRIVELVKILKDKGNTINLYGLEKCNDLKNFNHIENLEQAVKSADEIITSIPISKDGIYFNSQFTNEKIDVKEFFSKCKNKKIITGNITEEIQQSINESNKNQIFDVLKNEKLTILNAIPTAEGAIQIAMEESNITINNSKCLVMGFGRIGKILSKMLQGIGAKVYCEARKQTDIAFIKANGYEAIDLKNLSNYLKEFDFIFNTIPFVILDKSNLQQLKRECLVIDLASKPGGTDFKEAEKMGVKTIWALALPGKVASKTSANYIYEIINENMF